MEENISLTIDGATANGRPGTTIFDAALTAGIDIPRLCHDGAITPSGNCRICVVEVEGSRTLVGSCHTPIAEGMVVLTHSPKVLESRRATIELLLAAHTGPCVADGEAHSCMLHGLASDLEVGPPRFRMRQPRLYAVEEGPYLRRDMSRCILCRKCIRACREIAGQDVYAVAYRGFGSKVAVDADGPLNKEVCKGCGICIEHCPTSALTWPGGAKKKEGVPKKAAEPVVESSARHALLNLLEERQRTEGFLSEAAMSEIASKVGLSIGEVYGVATFYSFLSTKPRGKHVIRICKGLPCYLKSGELVARAIAADLGIRPGETTADRVFSFELVNCIGACDRAPAMLVDDTVYGNLSGEKVVDILKSYRSL